MKSIYFLSLIALLLFEIANVYFIMPIPGSQEMNSIDAAYFLYRWRWVFRGGLLLLALVSAPGVFRSSRWKWMPLLPVLAAAGIAYMTNFQMAADTMFYQPSNLQFRQQSGNAVDKSRIVIGVALNGEAKAYPIQFMGYHHQVRDSVGGKPVMVTYCTVCRTGRVFEPLVQGNIEEFRLVGMDHFNAMFEDKSTGSWWRQATGEAAAGPLKGQQLPELPYTQTTLEQWLSLYPETYIMQPDTKFQTEYDSMSVYENGKLWGKLTRRDTASWMPKSWVVSIKAGGANKAFDWNRLLRERVIHDSVGAQPVLLVLANDQKSFSAFKRAGDAFYTLQNDTLICGAQRYNFIGVSQDKSLPNLEKINAYQEYWHSWQSFEGR